MQREFDAFKFNSTLGERNGINGDVERGRSETTYDGLRFLYRVCSFVHFTASFQRSLSSEGRRVCTQSGSGKRSRSVSKPALFFPSVPISTSTSLFDPRRNAGRPVGMGLSNVASGRRSPFYFSVLGFLSPTA